MKKVRSVKRKRVFLMGVALWIIGGFILTPVSWARNLSARGSASVMPRGSGGGFITPDYPPTPDDDDPPPDTGGGLKSNYSPTPADDDPPPDPTGGVISPNYYLLPPGEEAPLYDPDSFSQRVE